MQPLERPSKTVRKHESHELQALGTALLELPDERLDRLGLPEPLVDALREARRITSHEARRRQLQLVGRLMRSADVAAARRAVDELKLGRAHDALALHRAERWRVDLVADDAAATRFAAAHPGCDLQRLRALVRQARKDASAKPDTRSGRAWRDLFRFLRDQSREPTAPVDRTVGDAHHA